MKTEFNTVEVLGFKVFSDNLSMIPDNPSKTSVINTISPNSYGLSTKDDQFKNALKETDILALDGVYFAIASIMLKGKNIQRNQGPDVFYHFMDRLQKGRGKAFFLGSSEETLALIKGKAKEMHGYVNVETYSPPFKPEFTDADNEKMISEINKYAPDVLFIGMTCPKQEKWAIEHRNSINSKFVICIGNVFDWYAGTQKSIHPFWFKLRLGWLVRIFLRPEVFRRNIGNQMLFFLHVILIFLKLKKI